MNVTEYIQENIKQTVCHTIEDTPERFGLPHPYSVPTVGETFHAMFYWDTYFTNLALINLGDITQARCNAENFAALIRRIGYIPNANTATLCDRSQPPFFALMLRDIFDETGDKVWLSEMYPALVREHTFWQEERNTSCGLAHYGCDVLPEHEEEYARIFADRVGLTYTKENQALLASNFLAQAESGWDFNARFGLSSVDYCPADLNSLLWAMEQTLADFADILQNGEHSRWHAAADLRAMRMRSFLRRSDGVFTDRNAKNKEFSPYLSAAAFYPLFVGLATRKEAEAAVRLVLPALLHHHGIAPLEVIPSKQSYQWGAPNAWPCLQVIVADALRRYGYDREAEQIESAYTSMVENEFEITGALWEKYNVDTGHSDAVNEYEMPEMLGWTAGAYLHFKH